MASLAFSAIEVVKEAFGGDDVRTSLVVLRGVGLIDGQARPIGLTDVDRIRIDHAKAKKRLELGQRLAAL